MLSRSAQPLVLSAYCLFSFDSLSSFRIASIFFLTLYASPSPSPISLCDNCQILCHSLSFALHFLSPPSVIGVTTNVLWCWCSCSSGCRWCAPRRHFCGGVWRRRTLTSPRVRFFNALVRMFTLVKKKERERNRKRKRLWCCVCDTGARLRHSVWRLVIPKYVRRPRR